MKDRISALCELATEANDRLENIYKEFREVSYNHYGQAGTGCYCYACSRLKQLAGRIEELDEILIQIKEGK